MDAWLWLTIIPAFLWTLVTFLDKFLVEKLIKGYGAFLFFTNFLLIPTFIGVVWFHGFTVIPASHMLLAIVSGMLFVYCFIFYAKALEIEETSRVIPLFSLVSIFTLLFGSFVLRESLSLLQIVGVLIVFFGSLLLTSRSFGLHIFKPRKVLYLMAASSLLLSAQFALFKFISSMHGYWVAQSYEIIGSFLACISFLLIPHERKGIIDTFHSLSPKWKILIFVGTDAIDVLATFIFRFAFTLAPIALVSAVGNVQYVFIYVMGIVFTLFFPKFIKEDIEKKQLIKKFVAIVIILVGITILA